jgi:hypothetical protein
VPLVVVRCGIFSQKFNMHCFVSYLKGSRDLKAHRMNGVLIFAHVFHFLEYSMSTKKSVCDPDSVVWGNLRPRSNSGKTGRIDRRHRRKRSTDIVEMCNFCRKYFFDAWLDYVASVPCGLPTFVEPDVSFTLLTRALF